MNAHDPLEQTVREHIAENLSVELEEVLPERSYFDDLGGESIDLLDLSFQLEQTLGVRVKFDSVLAQANDFLDEQGRLTGDGIELLQTRAPFFDTGGLQPGMQGDELRGLLTVDAITEITRQAVGESDKDSTGQVA